MVFTSFVVDVGSPRMEIQETESAKPEYFKKRLKEEKYFQKRLKPISPKQAPSRGYKRDHVLKAFKTSLST